VEQLLSVRVVKQQTIGFVYDDLKRCVDVVIKEFTEYVESHEAIDAKDFNDDNKYKKITMDTIEGRNLSELKMNFYFEERIKAKTHDSQFFERILSTPFQKFSSSYVQLQIATGIFDFPWQKVCEQEESIDFGKWCPSALEDWQLDKIRQTVGLNTKLMRVWLLGHVYASPAGWMAPNVILDKELVPACANATAFLLSANTSITNLELKLALDIHFFCVSIVSHILKVP
jgi:hypothetical protein